MAGKKSRIVFLFLALSVVFVLGVSAATQTDPNPIFDASFVRRIEQSGFIAALQKK